MSKSKWFYDRAGEEHGPISVAELRQLAATGGLQPTDRVRREDMDRWVRARAVKGLFGSAVSSAGDTVFDFLGAAPPAEQEPATEFNPAFDFFGQASSAPSPSPLKVSPPPSPPAEEKRPPRRTIPASAPPEEVAFSTDFDADVPMATPIAEDEPPPPPPPAASADLTGPELALQPDGTTRPTGGVVELSLTGGWLLARSAAPDGSTAEVHLRLSRLDAAILRDRPGAGTVLSFHVGPQTVAVQCTEVAEEARAFLRRVLDAAG